MLKLKNIAQFILTPKKITKFSIRVSGILLLLSAYFSIDEQLQFRWSREACYLLIINGFTAIYVKSKYYRKNVHVDTQNISQEYLSPHAHLDIIGLYFDVAIINTIIFYNVFYLP